MQGRDIGELEWRRPYFEERRPSRCRPRGSLSATTSSITAEEMQAMRDGRASAARPQAGSVADQPPREQPAWLIHI